MKHLRLWVPILGILNIVILFFQMPETPNLFGLLGCKTCTPSDPFFVFIAAGYFASLIAISLLFPNFPNQRMAFSGLIWALSLAVGLTYLHLPNWCIPCLIGHALHISTWIIWCLASSPKSPSMLPFFKERIYFLLLTPMIVIALFACLNITFLIYHFKDEHELSLNTIYKSGDMAPSFNLKTLKGTFISHENLTQTLGTVINFVTANCPYCNQQLPILNAVAKQLVSKSYNFINVSAQLTDDLTQKAAFTEWVEDKEGELHRLFEVKAYPTTFIIGNDGKIRQIILGVPENLEASLQASILKTS